MVCIKEYTTVALIERIVFLVFVVGHLAVRAAPALGQVQLEHVLDTVPVCSEGVPDVRNIQNCVTNAPFVKSGRIIQELQFDSVQN